MSVQQYYLEQMGITSWRRQASELFSGLTANVDLTSLDLSGLQSVVSDCRRCALCETRTQTVFGVGAKAADVMIVGEAPGYHEDKTGEPFVGRAGQLLNAMLQSVGLAREEVFISNILKCRPPENRDPLAAEVLECTPFLERQVALIAPKVIVALGRHAAHYLLKSTKSLSNLRGTISHYGSSNTPVLVTYHPAYLLREPRLKAEAYQDWRRLHVLLSEVS